MSSTVDKIQEKQRMLEEMKFKQRELKSNLSKSINDIHSSISDYESLGILDEEQIKFLKDLNINNLDTISFEGYKDIVSKINELRVTIEENAKELLDKIEELERGI